MEEVEVDDASECKWCCCGYITGGVALCANVG